ncbi:universal stress protein [Halalkalicoccus jeotgali]|uniref:Universal stress protein n=1 Tax=Halalkalicoccus jeotgali (strain DSM 18796 / CECT 7217 / JCM 14584 / KCTC 4019 / B3) TaxID=795797 RepID=D8J440_HALJB|nr:universal stress protein [Halalkalicoccus jeotgali]ADJ15432.1 universal stress protein [Halalkalicoccus jeotgali B3]ELY36159.1 universal stress protein [Halalkalicoccus jeotgali B3]
MYQTILVPIDGSEPANRAVEHALDLAENYGAAIHTLHVVDTARYGEPTLSSAEIVLNELEERGYGLLEEVADLADDRAVVAGTRLCRGRPQQEILEYADEIDADLIVLGSRGQSHQLGGHIGSVAERVVRSADRPVLTT